MMFDLQGRVGVFDHEGDSILAVVLAEKKGRYLALSERNREIELIPQRIQLLAPHKKSATAVTTAERVAALKDLRDTAEKLELPISLAELWELTSSNPREYALTELTELLFSVADAVQEFSLRMKLASDKVYFKRNQNAFSPRPSETVAQLLEADRIRREQEGVRVQFIEFVAKRIREGSSVGETSPAFGMYERLLRRAASLAPLGPNETKELQVLLESIEESAKIAPIPSYARAALRILRASNLVPPNFNPVLERSEVRKEFSEEVVLAAKAVVHEPNYSARRDLTALEVVTIDDVTTKDIDDGLSFERLEDGSFRVGVHITDVGALLSPTSLLAKEAKARATSMYLPETKLHMFPRVLSQGAFSLNPGEVRMALSCFVTFSSDLSITTSEVAPTVVKSKGKVSYDELDVMLGKESSHYHVLRDFCVRQEEKRLKDGAFRVVKPELFVDVGEDGQVQLQVFDEHSPARHVIAELAILSNQLFADYAAEHDVPYIYRTQDTPTPNSQLETMEEGPAKHFMFRVSLPRSFTSIKPLQHSGLGLKRYGQITSPIRRFADIINQWQVGAALKGEQPLFTGAEVARLIEEIETPLSRAQATTKDSRRFWLLRYLEQKSKRTLSGTVVRVDGKFPLIELDEVYFINSFRCKSKPQLGQKLIVTVKEISSLDDNLKLEA